MKKHPNILFFVKCILLTLPLFILMAFTYFFPFAYMDEEYPSWAYSLDIATNGGENYEIVILGDSRAMADIIPASLDKSAVNLGIGGATPIEMYYTLDNYLKNHEKPEQLLIMFAPFHYSVIDNYWQRNAYFNYLSISETAELFKNAAAGGAETITGKDYLIDEFSLRLRLPHKYLPALLNSRFINRNEINHNKYNEYISSKGHGLFGTLDGCSDLNYEVNYTEMHKTGDAGLIQLYMEKLLSLCDSYQLETVVLQPPMNEASYSQLKESYVDDYTNYLNQLSSNHKNIVFETAIPCYSDSLFGDSSHLNRAGALEYSSELISRLNELCNQASQVN